MTYDATIFENIDSSFIAPYKDGDRLEVYARIKVSANAPETALDYIFVQYNKEDRPTRRLRRPMCCGDVIALTSLQVDEEPIFWTCDFVDWRQITATDEFKKMIGGVLKQRIEFMGKMSWCFDKETI